MCDIHRWLTEPPIWCDEELHLLVQNFSKNTPKKPVNIEEIIIKSDKFPINFPIETIRNKSLIKIVPKHILERNIQSSYPIIHENVLNLCAKFLLFKLMYGTSKEKKLYEHITVLEFIQRLLVKRAATFIGKNDIYVLRDGTNGYGNWNTIGTDNEKYPLLIRDYLSYDEIKLSAFLSVSSYSYLINSGKRYNRGEPAENRENIQSEAIIIGLIGTRLEKPNVMEFEEIIITNTQNTPVNGYGNCCAPTIHSLFSNFYQENSYLFNNVRYGPIEDVKGFKELHNGDIFDNITYAKRLAVSFDTLLLEANHRAMKAGKVAYIHVVGIGLGNWRRLSYIQQEEVFVDTFGIRMSAMGANTFNIADVHFSYFPRTIDCLGVPNGNIFEINGHPNEGIKIHISERDPYEKLEDPDKLLIVSYAWDGNAFPGNEFWKGLLENSGDSSTASASQISELHNPFINETVCSDNLMVATFNGVLPIHEYIAGINNNASC